MSLASCRSGSRICAKCLYQLIKIHGHPQLTCLTSFLKVRCYSQGRRTGPDHYKALGLSQSATAKEIKSAYYKMSFKYHPDKNVGNDKATALFREITEAYEILGNVITRKQYDKSLGDGQVRAEEKRSEKTQGGPQDDEDYTSFYRRRSRERQTRSQERARNVTFTQSNDEDAYYRMYYGPTSTRMDGTPKSATVESKKQRSVFEITLASVVLFWVVLIGIDFMMSAKPAEEPGLVQKTPK